MGILTETKVTGHLGVLVSNLEAFVQDPTVQDAFKASIAEFTDTDLAWVDIFSTLKPRRRMGAERRLSSNVLVSYTITISSDAVEKTARKAASITTTIPSLTTMEI